MEPWIFLDGQYRPADSACISVQDRGLLFGDGAFTTMRVQEGHIVFAEAHLSALADQLRGLRIQAPSLSREALQELVRQNGALEGLYRLKVVVTAKDEEGAGGERPPGHVIALLAKYRPPPESALRLSLYPYPISGAAARFKSLSYVERFMMARFAKEAQSDDCVCFSPEGYLLETAHANLFWLKGRALYTPARSLPLYSGVTLKMVLACASALGWQVEEARCRLQEFDFSAPLFLCNALRGVVPIAEVGGKECAPSDGVERQLLQAVQELSARV